MTMNLNVRPDYSAATRAERVLNIATIYPEFEQSESWLQYAAAFDIARTLAETTPPVLPGLAEKPAKVEAIIREHAAATVEHQALVKAAEIAASYACDSLLVESRNACYEIVEMVSEQFANALKAFRDNLDAPEALTGYETAPLVESYQARNRAANDMLSASSFRTELGRAIDEPSLTHSFGLWTYLEAPTEDEDAGRLQTWLDITQSAADIVQVSPVEQVKMFVTRDLPLSIAPLGEIGRRVQTWEQARNRAAGRAQLTTLGETQRRQALGLAIPAGAY